MLCKSTTISSEKFLLSHLLYQLKWYKDRSAEVSWLNSFHKNIYIEIIFIFVIIYSPTRQGIFVGLAGLDIYGVWHVIIIWIFRLIYFIQAYIGMQVKSSLHLSSNSWDYGQLPIILAKHANWIF